MVTRILTGILVLLLPVAAHAELYRWVDDKGTVNFTEDYESIPPKYRKSAKGSDDAVSQKKPSAPAAGSNATSPSAVAPKGDGAVPLYGGRRGEEWRDELRQARAELKAYREHLELKRRLLADTSRMGRREYVGLQADVKELELKVGELKDHLERLEAAAAKAGVPSGFR
jgi:hypothetical protein